MREIKFRAWDIVNKKMKNWEHLIGYCDVSYLFDGATEGYGEECRYFNYPIPMQSTGLKGYMSDKFQDREEKEVYQGDHITIFQKSLHGGFYLEEYITGVVDLDETGTAFVIKNAKIESNVDDIPRSIGDVELSVGVPSEEDLKEVFLHDFDLTSDDITINGNIYENPSLLEESK